LVSVDLQFTPPSASQNTLEVTVEASDYSVSDSDTTTATGNVLANLWIDIDPATHVVTSVNGVELTGGQVAFSDMSFTLDFSFLGSIEASGKGIACTLDTPNPPGSVNNGVFDTADHLLIINQGQFDAEGSGIVGGFFDPVSLNLADDPIEATTEGEGMISVTAPVVVDDLATYEVTVRLPVEFDELVIDQPLVTVAGSGVFEAVGEFSRTISLQQVLTWDGDGDGEWGEIDTGSGFSRWQEDGGPAVFFPDATVDAVVRTNRVTVAENREARSLSVESGGVSIAPEQTLIVDQDATFSADTTIGMGVGAELDVNGSLETADSQYVYSLGQAAPGVIDVAGDVNLAGQNTLTLRIDGSDPFRAGTYPLIEPSGQGGITGSFTAVTDLGDYVTGDGLSVENGTLTLTIEKNLHPGDADFDTKTNVLDFNVWNAHKFTDDTDWITGDFDGDGKTNVLDFNVWNAAKFTSAEDGIAQAVAAGQVPEPASWLLLAGGCLALAAWRRRRI
jgi:hypothetical protein